MKYFPGGTVMDSNVRGARREVFVRRFQSRGPADEGLYEFAHVGGKKLPLDVDDGHPVHGPEHSRQYRHERAALQRITDESVR